MKGTDILKQVAQEHGYQVEDLLGHSRKPAIVSARRAAMIRLKLNKFSVARIAKITNRHESTVSYHVYETVQRAKQQYRVAIRPEYVAALMRLARLTDGSVEAAVNQAVSDMLESA